ncbi:MAG: NAD-dependent epimerase/dehydratase family protein [Proteobacteria bacterium]|nr:NAD-dependent epimerase/dehydratase family protein [Pseudomonadota bacterium]MBU1739223.1 NAD-dependent epimerase/dehydratase family protein [Pseudomonadota bacterium]
MKVLVTGGCGFIGSHVCEFYRNIGWDVVSIDNMTKYELEKTGYDAEKARNFNWNFLEDMGVKNVKADIRNIDEVLNASSGCDYIVHTAAQPAMTLSTADPYLDLTCNVVGTYNVLEAARNHNIPIVSCASIHVYGTDINSTLSEAETRYIRNPASIDETATVLTGNLTPLHASKFSAECYVRTFIDTYKVKAASFRLTGLYGTRQFGGEDHGWVANFSIRALANRPITIFNTGKQVRDILYATDLCKAFHAFYEKQVPGIYNIGGGEKTAISLIECLSYLEELLGREIEYHFGGERWGDLYYWISDCHKAEKLLGWKAETKPHEGIKMLVEWINDNMDIFQ